MKPNYDLVIVSHNSLPELQRCIASLDKIAPEHVVIVDSCSTDGTVEFLSSVIKTNVSLDILLIDENVGYSRAAHLGAKECHNEVIGICNGDVAFTEILYPMIDYLWMHKDIGAIGPKQVDSQGRITYAGTVFYPCGMKTLLGSWHRGWHEKDVGQYEDIIDVQYLSGSAFFTRRKVWDEFGGFDIALPLYFEDTLFCFRAQKKGYRIVYFGGKKMIHEWHRSKNDVERRKRLFMSMENFRKICVAEGIEHRLEWFKTHKY